MDDLIYRSLQAATSKIIMTDNKDDNNYKTLTALLELSEVDEFKFSLMEPFCRL